MSLLPTVGAFTSGVSGSLIDPTAVLLNSPDTGLPIPPGTSAPTDPTVGPVQSNLPDTIINVATNAVNVFSKVASAFFNPNSPYVTKGNFVTGIQNPFGQALAQLVNLKDSAIAAGTANPDMLNQVKSAIINLWNQFLTVAAQYGRTNASAQITANRGIQTLNGPNGLPGFPNGFINTVLAKIDSQIQALGGTPTPVNVGLGGSNLFQAGFAPPTGASGTTWLLVIGLAVLLFFTFGTTRT